MEEKINSIMELLEQIESDLAVPKNVKIKVKNTMEILQEGNDTPIKVDKSLQELDEIGDDPNVPQHIRTQIWNIVSSLESI